MKKIGLWALVGLLCGVGAALTGCPEAPVVLNEPVEFLRVTPNGNASQTTNLLSLYFKKTGEKVITELNYGDFTLSGVDGLIVGTLNGPYPVEAEEGVFRYDLGVSVTKAGGTLSVTVAKKGYDFGSSGTQSVTIFYVASISFLNVSTDGILGYKTSTWLELTFDCEVPGLSLNDIILESVLSIRKTELSAPVKVPVTYKLFIEGVTDTAPVTVKVEKTGFNITGSPLTVSVIFYRPPVQFMSVVADGSATADSTQLTLGFSQPIEGLSAADITLSGISGITSGALSGPGDNGPPYLYTLPISGFSESDDLTVEVAKAGYAITSSMKTVKVWHTIPVSFLTVNANADNTGVTSAMLTLIFNAEVKGLSSNDISLSGVDGVINVIKGALSGDNPYDLPISGFSMSGTLEVAVSKAGYRITPPSLTVDITYTDPVFNTVKAFQDWLRLMSNNPASPYNVKLKSLKDGETDDGLAVSTVLKSNSYKYVNIELDGIGYIYDNAFEGCASLVSINTGNVTSIGANAFKGCANLASVTIGSGASSIENNAFTGCGKLAQFIVTEGNVDFTAEDGALYGLSEGVKYEIKAYPAGKTGAFVIPNSVGSLRDYLFKDCSISKVTIPGDVVIGEGAFSGCTNLTEAGFSGPASITSIGKEVFKGCTSLASITIPSTVTSIGQEAFSGCGELQSILFPSSVTSIGQEAFKGAGLTSLTIPYSVSSIETGAFENCVKLTSVTSHPVNLSFPTAAFKGCINLNTISISGGTSIGNQAFMNTRLNTTLDLTNVINIGEEAFSGSRLSGVTFETTTGTSSVGSIGKKAFANCTSLHSITLPSSLNWLENDAFDGSGLTSMTINTDFITINIDLFKNISLTGITFHKDFSGTVSPGAFSACKSLSMITVTGGGSPQYSTDANNCVLYDYSKTTIYACAPGKTGSFTVPNTVTTIEESAFENARFNSVSFEGTASNPSAINSIGKKAFLNSGLTGAFAIPASVTSIGDNAFGGARITSFSITSISNIIPSYTVSNGVLYQYDGTLAAYPGGSSTVTFTIPAAISTGTATVSITAIGAYAFYGGNIANVTIPSTIIGIGAEAFNNCANLNTVEFKTSTDVPSFNLPGLREDVFPGNLITLFYQGAAGGTPGKYTRTLPNLAWRKEG
jgi:hypothetical protein